MEDHVIGLQSDSQLRRRRGVEAEAQTQRGKHEHANGTKQRANQPERPVLAVKCSSSFSLA